MKTFSIEDIVFKARTKIDEIVPNDSGFQGMEVDGENLDTIIRSCIPEAYRLVTLLADASEFEGKDGSNFTLFVDDENVGKLALPDDFLKLVSIKLSSWKSSCSGAVSEDSVEYRMQSNRWTCGTKYSPLVALVHTCNGRQLELYKASGSNDTLEKFVYIPSIDISTSNINLSEQLADAYIYIVAGLTMTSFREDLANDLFKVGRSLLGLE